MKTITAARLYAFTFLTSLIFLTSACNRSHSDTETLVPLKAEVLIADISANKCLNLEKLNTQLQNPQFNVPAAIMITNLKPLNDISRDKTEFFSYSSFYYKVTKARDLNLFTAAHQTDCQSIQLLTASNEVLTYNITDHADNQITFVLTDAYQENIPDYEKKTLENRLEPYEYTVTYVSAHEIKVIEKFRSIDPLCDKKGSLKFEITKNISWADVDVELPKQYQVDPSYLSTVQQALQVATTPLPPVSIFSAALEVNADPVAPTDPTVTPPVDPVVVAPPTELNDPARRPTDIISVDEILKIMQTPIRDELKLCS